MKMKSDKYSEVDTDKGDADIGRREALGRLGLMASAVYVAPVLATLSRSANAHDGSDGSSISDMSAGSSLSAGSDLSEGSEPSEDQTAPPGA